LELRAWEKKKSAHLANCVTVVLTGLVAEKTPLHLLVVLLLLRSGLGGLDILVVLPVLVVSVRRALEAVLDTVGDLLVMVALEIDVELGLQVSQS
jgi:hypothetical protein